MHVITNIRPKVDAITIITLLVKNGSVIFGWVGRWLNGRQRCGEKEEQREGEGDRIGEEWSLTQRRRGCCQTHLLGVHMTPRNIHSAQKFEQNMTSTTD